MFHVIFFLALLCPSILSLKLHTPGGRNRKVVPLNAPVKVHWSREGPADPASILLLVENIGGVIKPMTDNVTNASAQEGSALHSFDAIGTFRLWAINPLNASNVYTKSKQFEVRANDAAAGAAAQAANGGDDDTGDGDDTSAASSPPSPPGTGRVGSSPSPPSTSTTTPSPSSTTTPAHLKPYILGAIIGGAVLLLILAGAAIFFLCRRGRRRVERRTTFHRTRMVKSLPPPTFAVPEFDSSPSAIDDKEKGYILETRYIRDAPYPFARTQ
ncbi:hypothetical protein DFH09DRAFT_294825 [Mycena vulgaris]|nr:hypothetical protein DFH09DRAFT_294825 [Mycena vulgaris]